MQEDEEPNFEGYELEDNHTPHENDDVISKDSLEEDSPNPTATQKASSDKEEVELVYNSMLGLYYDPVSKQHFEVKP